MKPDAKLQTQIPTKNRIHHRDKLKIFFDDLQKIGLIKNLVQRLMRNQVEELFF